MRRIQFVELHEQPWFPSSLRDDVTDAIQFGFNLLKAYGPIAPLLQSVIDSTASGINRLREDDRQENDRPKNDLRNDDLQNDDLQNDDLQNDDLQKNDLQNDDLQKNDLQKNDLQNKHLKKNEIQKNDLPASDPQNNRRQSIVDMCSGGGGPWLDLSRKLRCRQDSAGLQIWLTDKYPNLEAFQNVSSSSDHLITYYPDPVDARAVPRSLKGLRTMFTSFHHFSPEDARAILQNAVDAGESIGIFEITRRSPSTVGIIFVGVLLLFLHTPRIRPFRWSRLIWTYLIPIIPFVLLFDGIVSCLRTYRPQELREIVDQLTSCEYKWELGELAYGRAPITYLLGHPGNLHKESPGESKH